MEPDPCPGTPADDRPAGPLVRAGVLLASVVVVGSTAVSGPAPDAATDPLPRTSADALQTALEAWAEDADVVGVTAAVATGQGVWSGATGVDGTGARLHPEAAAPIAGITRTFVAAQVVLLAERGEVDLDAPVGAYVDLPFEDGGATVREALGMRSGFPHDPSFMVLRQVTDLDRRWRPEEVLGRVLEVDRQGTRGGAPADNDVNYLVLGELVEEVTGDPLHEVLRRDLLAPAGIDRVWLQPAEQPSLPLATPADSPGSPPVDVDGPHLPSTAVASVAGAAGGMAGDARSLARWGLALYGEPGDEPLLDASGVGALVDGEGDDRYGLGTVRFADDGTEVGHDGDLVVAHSALVVWPEAATSVAVLVPHPAKATIREERTAVGLARALHDASTW